MKGNLVNPQFLDYSVVFTSGWRGGGAAGLRGGLSFDGGYWACAGYVRFDRRFGSGSSSRAEGIGTMGSSG